jgi:Lrp/AsnC family transcriptional regulator, leucine-responsive regulatory protein
VDDTDRQIVGLLRDDARLTYAQIAERVGLAPSSVHDRVRKLERADVIRGYKAVIDPVKIGLPITAFVTLRLRPSSPTDLPARISEFELVESCYSVAGDNSYVLIIRSPSTSALEDLLDALRAKLEVQTASTIVLSTPFEHRPVVTHEPNA